MRLIENVLAMLARQGMDAAASTALCGGVVYYLPAGAAGECGVFA